MPVFISFLNEVVSSILSLGLIMITEILFFIKKIEIPKHITIRK